jgi:16S rRNA processing protein RimM
MIRREDLVKIGKFNKPHGIKGELSFSFTNSSFERDEHPFLLCELDGIFVPFSLINYRFTSDSAALVRLQGVDSDAQASLFINKTVYFPKNAVQEELADEDYTWDYFIGFTLIDEKAGELGVISDVDSSTLNTLFVIEKGDEEEFFPAADELVTHIDETQKRLYVLFPEGLFG